MDAHSDSALPGEQHAPEHGIPIPPTPWLAGGALLIVTMALVVVTAIHGAIKLPSPTAGRRPFTGPTTVVGNWQVYRDPAGLYTVRIPRGWTATTTTGIATVGDRTGSGQETIEYTKLADPGNSSSTITIYISAYAFDSPFLHAYTCSAGMPGGPTNATVAGLPAVYIPRIGWVFNTDKAHYQVGYLYPGYTGSVLQASAPTPIPAAMLQAGQQLMNQILATFTPSSTQPLVC